MAFNNTNNIHIRYSDIDSMGHVNNAVYLSYFEEARISFFKSLLGEEWNWEDFGIIIARNEIDYYSPVLFNDIVSIRTAVLAVGNKSFTLQYELLATRQELEIICASGKSIAVCFDFKSKQTIAVPEVWKNAMLS